MSAKKKIRENRIKKISTLESAGYSAYPSKTKRTHTIKEALSSFKLLEKKKEEVILVGRIRAERRHGKLTFLTLEDGTENIQVFISEETVGKEGYRFFTGNFDVGDFAEVKGFLFHTKRGEKTVRALDYKMLAKSILPLPEKWHGLKDEEERFRKRYLDIMFNPEVKEMIKKKALFWNSVREFLVKEGFWEVETPALETVAGGADAKPFKSYYNALGIDVYLRISTGELWQKKLMVAGFEKTFEIGRQFRNEGISYEHLQDYTQMEFYWAYADYKKGMKLVERLYKHIARKTFGTLKFRIRGFEVDLSKKWERYDYWEVIKKHTGVDINELNLAGIKKELDKLGIKYEKRGLSKGRATDYLWKYCRKKLKGPGFLINVPAEVSPLAKRNIKNPEIAERFQVILAGSEVGNGYSELNNPLEQAERFKEQQELRDKGDEEAQMYDHDFVEALEYGMPPTCGFGLSERLFSFLIDKPARECQTFPLVRPKKK